MSSDNERQKGHKQIVIMGNRHANRDQYVLPESIKLTNQKMEVRLDAVQHTTYLVILHTTQRSRLSQSSRRPRLLVAHLARGRAVLASGRILPILHLRLSSCMHNSQTSTTARRYGVIESVILPIVMRHRDIQEAQTKEREYRRVWIGSTGQGSNGTNR